MNMKPDPKQRVIGLLVAALMTALLIWLVNSGARQALAWLTGLPNKSQGEVRASVGVLLALVLPLVAYRLRRLRKKPGAELG